MVYDGVLADLYHDEIAYIHEHGVIHRDIKEQNAKLTASGIARSKAGKIHLTVCDGGTDELAEIAQRVSVMVLLAVPEFDELAIIE